MRHSIARLQGHGQGLLRDPKPRVTPAAPSPVPGPGRGCALPHPPPLPQFPPPQHSAPQCLASGNRRGMARPGVGAAPPGTPPGAPPACSSGAQPQGQLPAQPLCPRCWGWEQQQGTETSGCWGAITSLDGSELGWLMSPCRHPQQSPKPLPGQVLSSESLRAMAGATGGASAQGGGSGQVPDHTGPRP